MTTAMMFLAIATAQAPADDRATHLDQARRNAWQLAEIVVEKLVPDQDAEAFPGLKAFAEDVRKARREVDLAKPAGDRKPFDADALVTRNPNFWRANYEVAPGDPAWMGLHAALLLAGGEAARAQYVLALARLRPGIPKEFVTFFSLIENNAAVVLKDFNAEVQKGVEQFDAGKKDEALASYRTALKEWPQNGWADYEVGFTLMTREMEKRGIKPGKVQANLSLQDPEIEAKFADSRGHDPFQVMAYQGKAPDVVSRLKAAMKAKALFDRIAARKPLPDADLTAFTEACQAAGMDEMALLGRQMLVVRKGRFVPEDYPFLARSLRRLAPGGPTEKALEQLAGDRLVMRQLVEPDK